MAAHIFPLAEFHLFEPLAEINSDYRRGLDALKSRRGLRVSVYPIALDRTNSTESLGVSPDPMGSSLLATQANDWFPTVVQIGTAALDDFRAEHHLPVPELIKIDTQGAELRILEGGQRTIERAEVLIVEAWLSRAYGPTTPLLHELVGWMERWGFLVQDFAAEFRNENGFLFAKDLVFWRPGFLPSLA
jgi:FkbM family methyltransferase